MQVSICDICKTRQAMPSRVELHPHPAESFVGVTVAEVVLNEFTGDGGDGHTARDMCYGCAANIARRLEEELEKYAVLQEQNEGKIAWTPPAQ